MKSFQCSKCTACCYLQAEMGIVPKGENGACIYLTEEGECGVYEDRPLECNVGRMAKATNTPKKEYYSAVAKSCNKLMDIYEVDKEYRLDPKIYDE
tara:strand:+ start:649 stop:936 length:288 start_codon:yes stop_codon:yes gene_type:complete